MSGVAGGAAFNAVGFVLIDKWTRFFQMALSAFASHVFMAESCGSFTVDIVTTGTTHDTFRNGVMVWQTELGSTGRMARAAKFDLVGGRHFSWFCQMLVAIGARKVGQLVGRAVPSRKMLILLVATEAVVIARFGDSHDASRCQATNVFFSALVTGPTSGLGWVEDQRGMA